MKDLRYTPSSAVKGTTMSPSPIAMGGVGMIVGAAGSAAANIRRVNNGEIDKNRAVKNVLLDSAGSGIATAAATTLVAMIGLPGILSAAGMLATATAAKYLFDSAFEPGTAGPAPAPREPAKPAEKKSVKKAAAGSKRTSPKKSTSRKKANTKTKTPKEA
jgi:hypothetical protein